MLDVHRLKRMLELATPIALKEAIVLPDLALDLLVVHHLVTMQTPSKRIGYLGSARAQCGSSQRPRQAI